MKIKKGITLISLVVTIIVLLILVGITISMTIGPEGLIEKAKESKLDSRYAVIMDKIRVREHEIELAAAKKEEGESQEDFINRLITEDLITVDDDYDNKTIYLGKQKDGTYKYIINVLDESMTNLKIDELQGTLREATEAMKNMTFTIKTTIANQKIHLPINNTAGLQVNWDSANSPNNFVNFTEIELVRWSNYSHPNDSATYPVHTYLSMGTYQIQIKGIAQPNTSFGNTVFQYSNANNCEFIELKYWGENGFSAFNCFGKNKMTTVPSPTKNSFENVLNFDYLFNAAPNLSRIPENLFVNSTQTTSYAFTFLQCYSLTKIPANLFLNSKNAKSYYGTFNFCKGLTSIPEKLFINCSNVEDFSQTFYYCENLASIPEKLFINCSKVNDFSRTFGACKNLTFIPEKLFANSPLVTTFESVFSGAYIVTTIPEDLFSKNTNVINFNSSFEACTSITSIPGKLFINCTKVTDFWGTFRSCDSLTSIPGNLFENCSNVINFSSVFAYCQSLANIPETLFTNCTKVKFFAEVFSECIQINNIPLNLFNNCTLVEDFSFAFFNCHNLTGLAPTLWTRTNNPIGTSCFSFCYNLTNYSIIPLEWKNFEPSVGT